MGDRHWTGSGRCRAERRCHDNANLRAFARAVQSVAPEATEGPISILEARRAVVTAFIEAGAWALISIGILLWITLRRLGDVLLTLVPLLLAGIVRSKFAC